MIKLFNSTDKTFTSNGDKVIIPTKAKVHKEDNGAYYLDLETGLEYVNDLIQGSIIVAPTPQGEQAFRLSNPEKTKSKIKVRAYHVFYDSKNYLIADSYVVDKNCNDALDHLNSATDNPSPFQTASNIVNINSYRCVRKSFYEAISTVLERWGGHLVRDNFTIKVMASIGQDNGVTVRYAKNLKDITCIENWDNVVTKLMPVGKDGILLDNLYVYSTIQYSIPYTKVVSFNQDINQEDYPTEEAYEQALKNDLYEQAIEYVELHSIPQVNYTIKANLEKITDIGDTIEVIDERIGVDIITNLISYDYDCIQDKYTELEFGNFLPSLGNLISSITNETTQVIGNVSTSILEIIINLLTGQNCVFEGTYILVCDTLPKEQATNVFKIDYEGIKHSSTGINGNFTTVWRIDNTIDFSNVDILNLILSLSNLQGGTLKIGNTGNSYGEIEVYNSSNNKILNINKDGITGLTPTELYSDSLGSAGIITLSDSLANYSAIDIIYTDLSGNTQKQTRINGPQNSEIDLSIIEQGSNLKDTYIYRTHYSLSGTSIIPGVTNAGFILIQDTTTTTTVGTNEIKITKVLGYK